MESEKKDLWEGRNKTTVDLLHRRLEPQVQVHVQVHFFSTKHTTLKMCSLPYDCPYNISFLLLTLFDGYSLESTDLHKST